MLVFKHLSFVGSCDLKRILKWFGSFAVLLLLVFLGFTLVGMKRLKAYQSELAILEEQARASGMEAQKLLESGDYDLKVVLRERLLQKVLAELEGVENTSSKGNRIVLRKVSLKMAEGFVKLEAEADFFWRLGWYRGPVKASYFGFTRLLDDGRCQLDLRIAEAHPMNNTLLNGPWLESWLVLKLQRKLKFPDFTLPLSLKRDFNIPDVVKQLKKNSLTVTVPGRQLPIHLENPRVLVTPDALTLLVEEVAFEEVDDLEVEPAMPMAASQADLTASMRFSLLEDTLARAISPDKDVLLSAEFVPDVWNKKARVLGIKVHNRADLHDLDGYLNITHAALIPAGDKWFMQLVASGEVYGTVKGKAYGISATVPFQATPTFEDKIPVRLESAEDGMMIVFEDHPLTLNLKIKAELAGRAITINHPIETTSQELFQPISVPDLYEKDIKVPVSIVKKKIVKSRAVQINVAWKVGLPETREDILVFEGNLN